MWFYSCKLSSSRAETPCCRSYIISRKWNHQRWRDGWRNITQKQGTFICSWKEETCSFVSSNMIFDVFTVLIEFCFGLWISSFRWPVYSCEQLSCTMVKHLSLIQWGSAVMGSDPIVGILFFFCLWQLFTGLAVIVL